MRQVLGSFVLVAVMVAGALPLAAAPGEELRITGVVDGPLTGGLPKAIEVQAVTDIADLSDFGLGSANNGGGTDGEEFTFPAVSLSAGDFVYVASEAAGFEAFFGFAPTFTDGSAPSINGDDAVELFHDGAVVDVFGEISVDGSGQAWEYTDGWAKRVAGGPDGSTFVFGSWSFSGPDALDGASDNAGAANPYPVEDPVILEPPGPDLVFIHQIQDGASSSLAGERVVVEGIVVGDLETFDHLAGFFVQEEDADADGDPTTSEGIFVFNGSGDDVQLGDLVRVEGTVQERFGNTQLTDSVDIEVISSSNSLPSPTVVSFPLASTSDLEAVEGMLATFPQDLVVSEYFNYDRFGEVVVALPYGDEDRPYTPTAVADPGSTEMLDRLAWNQLSRITIDDGKTSQNPDVVVHPVTRDDFTLDNRFRGGDVVTGLVGPVYYDFSQYRILPSGHDAYEQQPRPAGPSAVGGRLTVASLNALNYFLTLDDGANDVCGADRAQECRGADTAEEFQRQRAKLLEALIGLDADVIGLNEIENTPGVEPLADIVVGLNAHFGPDAYTYVETGVAGPDAIKVGLIYRTTAVTQIGETAVLDSPEFLDPTGSGEAKNRAAVAASFLEKGTGEKFTVVVNHLKSKGSGCGPGDDDQYQGNCNLTRTLAAEALVGWLDGFPTDSKDSDVLIIGDLNSYDREDPIAALGDAGFVDLVRAFGGEFAYSYVFDGHFGYLDYAMANPSMSGQVTGATVWHINADEPDILDYDTSFKSDVQDDLYEADAYRSSDHDPVLVGLALDQKPGKGNKR